MRELWRGKAALLRFCSEYEAWLRAGGKFLASLLLLLTIASGTGGRILELLPVIVIAAALCAILPDRWMFLAAVAVWEAGLWMYSPAAAAVAAAVLLVAALCYVSFCPGQVWSVVGVCICLGLKIPFAAPVVFGLLCGPSAAVGIAVGTVLYYMTGALMETEAATGFQLQMLERVPAMFQECIVSREMILSLVVLLAVFCAVCLLRSLAVNYSWSLGILAGALVFVMLNGMEMLFLGVKVPWIQTVFQLAAGVLAGMLVQFLCHTPDYRRVQRLQFEDDDYYYYVKAVPKMEAGYDKTEKGDGGE